MVSLNNFTSNSQMTSRLFAISDLHIDFPANLSWIHSLDPTRYSHDALIVAGDVTHDENELLSVLLTLTQKFHKVFFVVGNHDVWSTEDSTEKMERIYEKAKALGVKCPGEADVVGGKVWVVPMDSWYSFDEKEEVLDGLDLNKLVFWRDFDKCKWSFGGGGMAGEERFDFTSKLREARAISGMMTERNEAVIERVLALQSIRHLPVVTFSHFVPRADLNPTFHRFKELKCVTVCPELDVQIRLLNSSVHVFGHTHNRTDRVVQGVRYVQTALGYPGEGSYCPRFADLTLNEIEL